MLRWKVKQLLERHNLTPYKVMKASGLAQGTVYRLANNEAAAVSIDTLNALIRALRKLTGKKIQLADLLEHED